MSDFKGLIFDFDGVVVLSLPVHLEAWNLAVMQIFNRPLRPELRLQITGLSTDVIAAILAEAYGFPARAAELGRVKRALLEDARNAAVPVVPGVSEFMHELTKAKVPFGIASNAPRNFIEVLVARLGLPACVIFGSEDSPRPKPYPDVFLLCARAMGLGISDHARTCVIEDSTHGMKAAVAAGMFPVGMTTQHSSSILLRAGARKTVDDHFEMSRFFWSAKGPQANVRG